MATSSRNRKRKKTGGDTDETEFSRYLDGAYAAAMAKIEALATEAREAIAQLYHGMDRSEAEAATRAEYEQTLPDEIQGEPLDRFCSSADVHDPHQWEDGEQIYYCSGVSYELIPCARHDVHDEHEWTHPDGRPCWCLGVGHQTIRLVRNIAALDLAIGNVGEQIYVMDEDQMYEYLEHQGWRPVKDGGEDQVGQEG